MKDNGNKGKKMDKAFGLEPMEIPLKVNGLMIKVLEKVTIFG